MDEIGSYLTCSKAKLSARLGQSRAECAEKVVRLVVAALPNKDWKRSPSGDFNTRDPASSRGKIGRTRIANADIATQRGSSPFPGTTGHLPEVRSATGAAICGLIADLLRSADISMDNINLVVPHQANGVMIRERSGRLGVAPDLMHMTIGFTGNTGAASVPICIDDAARTGRLSDGDVVLMMAFGGGFTWGGLVLRWNEGK